MPFIPALFTVGLKVYSDDGADAHGNPVGVWADPVDYPVCYWATPGSRGDMGEPKLAGHDRVIVALELCTPADFPASPFDRVVVDGREFEVVGYAEDFNHGPFGFVPDALVWNLRRVEG